MGLFSKTKSNGIFAPIEGKIATLESLKDGVFSEKMMGEGVVIKFDKNQKEGHVYAPASGKLVTAFPTGHAYGIQTKDNIELLLHIGIDTVNLKGMGFISHAKQGQKVKQGDLLVTVEVEKLKNKVSSIDPILIVTSGQKISYLASGHVTKNVEVFKIVK